MAFKKYPNQLGIKAPSLKKSLNPNPPHPLAQEATIVVFTIEWSEVLAKGKFLVNM